MVHPAFYASSRGTLLEDSGVRRPVACFRRLCGDRVGLGVVRVFRVSGGGGDSLARGSPNQFPRLGSNFHFHSWAPSMGKLHKNMYGEPRVDHSKQPTYIGKRGRRGEDDDSASLSAGSRNPWPSSESDKVGKGSGVEDADSEEEEEECDSSNELGHDDQPRAVAWQDDEGDASESASRSSASDTDQDEASEASEVETQDGRKFVSYRNPSVGLISSSNPLHSIA